MQAFLFFEVEDAGLTLPLLVTESAKLVHQILVLLRELMHFVYLVDVFGLLLLDFLQAHHLSSQFFIRLLKVRQLPLKLIYPLYGRDVRLGIHTFEVYFFALVSNCVEGLVQLF